MRFFEKKFKILSYNFFYKITNCSYWMNYTIQNFIKIYSKLWIFYFKGHFWQFSKILIYWLISVKRCQIDNFTIATKLLGIEFCTYYTHQLRKNGKTYAKNVSPCTKKRNTKQKLYHVINAKMWIMVIIVMLIVNYKKILFAIFHGWWV